MENHYCFRTDAGREPWFYVELDAGPQLALEQLLQLRAEGEAPISSTTVVLRERGLLPHRTDAYAPPVGGLTCTLLAFFSVLASDAARLGLAADPIVGLNNPIGFRSLSLLLLRNWAAPGGALLLLRAQVNRWELLRMTSGLFIFGGHLRRGDTFHPHAMSYNAGTGVLYLGPYVVVVQPSDKEQLDLFAVRMQLMYGIYLSSEKPFECRQIYINPMHKGAELLRYNVASALGGGASKSAKRRLRDKRPRKRGMKRARDD